MNYKDNQIIKLAQSFGYTTAKDLADFLKKYKPSIKTNNSGEKFIYLSLACVSVSSET